MKYPSRNYRAKPKQQAEEIERLKVLVEQHEDEQKRKSERIEVLSTLLNEAMSKVEELHNIHPHNISGVLSWWRKWFIFEEKVNDQ